jgi:hypothetical protein
MAVSSVLNAFGGGELSSKLYGRTDLDLYKQGLKTLENMVILPQGGIERRDGSVFAAPLGDETAKARLLSFEQSTDAAYAVCLESAIARFFTSDAQVRESATAITGATAANPVVITDTAHGYDNGDEVFIQGIVGMTEINDRWFTVANKNANDFELASEDGSAHTAYSSAGTAEKVYEIATPWVTADLFELQHAQDGFTMYLCQEDHPTNKLTRTSDTAWTLTEVDWTDGPYMAEDISGATLTFGATSGSTSCTASAATFVATDSSGAGGTGAYDRLIRVNDGTDWHWCKITAYTSTTVVTVTIVDTTLSGVGPHTQFRLGSFSDTTGYPACVSFFEQRLVLASTKSEPQAIWGSKTGLPETHTPGTDADSAISFTIAQTKMNRVRWLATLGTDLFAGTAGAEWNLTADSPPATPTNGSFLPHSSEGNALVMPINAKKSLIHLKKSGKRIFDIFFDGDTVRKAYRSDELTFHADTVTGDGVSQMAYAGDPNNAVWAIRDDGQMCALSYYRDKGVLGWARMISGGTSPAYETVTTIPRAGDGTSEFDQTWVVVKRTINEATHRYVEYLDSNRNTDSLVYYSGAAVATLSNLHHLEGETVVIKGDGDAAGTATVTGGLVTFNDSKTYSTAEVGLGYTHKVENLGLEQATQRGQTLGQKRRPYGVLLRLRASLGSTINGDPILARDSSDLMDSAPTAITGDYEMSPDSGWDTEGKITITGSEPNDFAITAMVIRQDVNEV